MNEKIGFEAHNLEKIKGHGAGVARVLLEEIISLNNSNLDDSHFFIFFKEKIPENRSLQQLFNQKNFHYRIAPFPFNRSYSLFYNIWLPWQKIKLGLDLMIFPCYMLPLFYFGRSIVIIHDVVYEAHPQWISPLYRFIYHLLSRNAGKRATLIQTISNFSKQEIIKYYHRLPKTIKVIYNPINANFYPRQDIQKIKEIKEKVSLKNKYIFYLGQMFQRRHPLESILAFEKLIKERPEKIKNYQFLFVGRNLTYPQINLKKEVDRINQEIGYQAIIYLDHLPNGGDDFLANLYSGAELFISVSDYEGFNLPPTEAMACGTPALLANRPEVKEIQGNNQFYVQDPMDINEFSQKIEEALFNQEKRENAIQNGLKQVKKYSLENHLKGFQEIVREAINK
ncbi:MAG TPA: glycosyltransferase family 1 protein [Candidatus Portnoybacteria bacterium]|nr:glycosyltransferase family 1 protein [Candidatus Portnoybacteria bacterium]